MAEDTEQMQEQPQEQQPQEAGTQETKPAGDSLAHSILHDEDGDSLDVQHLRELLAALQVDGKWFRKQIPMFLLIFVIAVAYVTNSYQAQQEILKEEELADSLEDCKYRCLTREGELTRRTRASQLERELRQRGDTTLVVGTEPPYKLEVK